MVSGMNAARHKKKETAYKGILILISLVLFLVRLSDKFYLSANRPYFNGAAKSSVHKIVLTAKTGLSKKCSFQPDKRYHSGNSFALLTPLFCQKQGRAPHPVKFYPANETSVSAVFPVVALRGPPVL
jgi:hypothetical protein